MYQRQGCMSYLRDIVIYYSAASSHFVRAQSRQSAWAPQQDLVLPRPQPWAYFNVVYTEWFSASLHKWDLMSIASIQMVSCHEVGEQYLDLSPFGIEILAL